MSRQPGRRAKRNDANQTQIVKELRQLGFSVETGHDDILVGKNGVTLWVEIKTKTGKLKPSQEKLLEEFKGAYMVAKTTEEIIAYFK